MKQLIISWIAACLLWTYAAPALAQIQQIPKDRTYFETRGEIIWEVPTDKKVIALTFDDGPDPIETVEIMELLQQYNAKATFFVLGHRVDRYPEVVKAQAAAGHEIANHTYHHIYFNGRPSPDLIRKEVAQTADAIFNAAGIRPRLFRPPGGYYNETMVNTIKATGHQIILWSWHQDTEDWKIPPVSKIVKKVLNNARNGDIVLFHDHVEGKSNTVKALKRILPELQRQGYEFITVSELISLKQTRTVKSPGRP